MPDSNATPARQFSPARMFTAMEKFGHINALGLKFRDHGDDWAELTLPWRTDLVGDPDAQTIATGAIITLMDMTAGVSVWTRLAAFRPQATLDLRVDYMRTAAPRADMIGWAQCYRVARDVCFVRGIAHDGSIDDPVATIAATFMFTGPVMVR